MSLLRPAIRGGITRTMVGDGGIRAMGGTRGGGNLSCTAAAKPASPCFKRKCLSPKTSGSDCGTCTPPNFEAKGYVAHP